MKTINNEKGTVLILALMIMVALTLISTVAVLNTNTDMQISINYRTAQSNFYDTEGSMEVLPGVIRRTIALQTETPSILTSMGISDTNGTTDDDGISDAEEDGDVFNCTTDVATPAASLCGLFEKADAPDANMSDFAESIMGYSTTAPPDFTIKTNSQATTVTTTRQNPEILAGFSTGFSTGYEGGSMSGVGIDYVIAGTRTEDKRNSTADIEIQYRCIERSGGGCL